MYTKKKINEIEDNIIRISYKNYNLHVTIKLLKNF